MTETVVAFDIDGTLTNSDARRVYNSLQILDDVSVGIVTSNPPHLATRFSRDNNLEADFNQSALVKLRALLGLRMVFIGADVVYVGDTFRDKLSAKAAGWEFVHVSEIEDFAEREFSI